jgi:hypothetical protein
MKWFNRLKPLIFSILLSSTFANTDVPDLDELYATPKTIVLCSMLGGKSHIKYMLEISKTLADRGHHIIYASSEDQTHWARPYNFTEYSFGPNPVSDELNRQVTQSLSMDTLSLDTINILTHAGTIINYHMVFEGLVKLFKQQKVGLVVCDFLVIACMDAANHMNVTVAGSFPSFGYVGSSHTTYISNRFDISAPTTANLNFFQRFNSVIAIPLAMQIHHITVCYKLNALRKQVNVPPLYGNTWKGLDKSVIFVDTFYGFDAARPLPPLIQPIGPILPESYPPLTSELKEFFEIHNRVMYIAFGTIVYLDKGQITSILEGILISLRDGVIDGVIWSLVSTRSDQFPNLIKSPSGSLIDPSFIFENLHPHIKIMSYTPQYAILKNENTKLFVSHCGIESSFEAMYLGKPILAIPFFGDQLTNAGNLVEAGVALSLDRYKFTVQSFVNRIKQILVEDLDVFMKNTEKLRHITYVASKNRYIAADLIEKIAFFSHSDIFQSLPQGTLSHWVTADKFSGKSWLRTTNWDVYIVAYTLLTLFIYGTLRVFIIILSRIFLNRPAHSPTKLKKK